MGKKKKKGLGSRLMTNLRNNPSAFTDILGGLLTAFDHKNAGKAMKPKPKNQPAGNPKPTMGSIGMQLMGRGRPDPYNRRQ